MACSHRINRVLGIHPEYVLHPAQSWTLHPSHRGVSHPTDNVLHPAEAVLHSRSGVLLSVHLGGGEERLLVSLARVLWLLLLGSERLQLGLPVFCPSKALINDPARM